MSLDKTAEKKVLYEISQIDKEFDVIDLLSMKANSSPLDSIELRAAATAMQSLYNGYEKILIIILKSKKCSIPGTKSWHSDLLLLAIDKDIISEHLEIQLRDLMAFRHFVRHAYSFMLANNKLEPLLRNMKNLYNDFKTEILGNRT